MAFVNTTYAANSGAIFPIRMKDTYFEALTTQSGGTATESAFVKVSKTNREFGLRPRGARLVRTVGAAPNTFKKYSFIQALTAASLTSQLTVGSTIEIGGVTWTVLAHQPEDY